MSMMAGAMNFSRGEYAVAGHGVWYAVENGEWGVSFYQGGQWLHTYADATPRGMEQAQAALAEHLGVDRADVAEVAA